MKCLAYRCFHPAEFIFCEGHWKMMSYDKKKNMYKVRYQPEFKWKLRGMLIKAAIVDRCYNGTVHNILEQRAREFDVSITE